MDESSFTEAMKLFDESKHLLQTSISAAVGTGTVNCFPFRKI